MTTLAEFRRKVFLLLHRHDGETNMAFEQAINDAHKVIARVIDLDDCMVLDTSNAHTVANQHRYHILTDWALTRPKDIYSIRYMANEESRKLVYIPSREWDEVMPYPNTIGTGKPTHYTQKGLYVELLPVPDANATLYIYHSQWPAVMSNDTDESQYTTIDDVILQLTVEMTQAYLEGGVATDWTKRALTLLGQMKVDERYKPDVKYIARPFSPYDKKRLGKYWIDPFVKK